MHLDFLDEQIDDLEQQIATMIANEPPPDGPPAHGVGETLPPAPAGDGAVDGDAGSALSWADAVELLDTITGVGQMAAEQMVAEIGTDMGRFASGTPLDACAGRV